MDDGDDDRLSYFKVDYAADDLHWLFYYKIISVVRVVALWVEVIEGKCLKFLVIINFALVATMQWRHNYVI